MFELFLFENQAESQQISYTLCSYAAQICSSFLKRSVKMFELFLIENQAESQQINLLDDSMQKLMRKVLYKFTEPCAMANKLVFDVESNSPYNLKDHKEIAIGAEAYVFISEKMCCGVLTAYL
ncbi:hypothetical protein PoB_000688100 [Plakobranchus ocellatus]|uniref:Uncharacterized protein n=1 Tax=Plakobranchus ocellatus TaxID=259542 RepID=A0AAV3XZI8_9GAST|nr:hypothetical protein PoB_000688100 [Plakobranchus ocellatus]